MTAPTIRADYDALGQVAGQFSQQTDNARQTLQKLKQAMDTLQGGDWVGQGATQFYSEMNSSVLPTMQRLVNALENGASTAQAISKAMKEAETAAARIFSVQATGLAQAPGGAGGAGGGSGSGGTGGGSGAGGSGSGSGGGAAAPAAVTDSILNGTIKAANAPNSVTLPAVFDKGMQDAWKDSFPGGHEKEQGGLLVKNAKGDYEMIRGPAGTGGTWTPNYKDIGSNTYLGLAHTHPYDSGDVDVPYSDADISFLFQKMSGHQAEIMTVQSGNTQFLLGRTDEFNQAMAGKTQAQIDTTVAEMTKLYNDTVAAQKAAGASFPDRYQAATKAVADKYNLIYYKGQNGNLTKQ